MKEQATEYFRQLQDRICARLEALDGEARFHEDRWSYAPGEGPGEGGGVTRVLSGGRIFEKGGVNVSAIQGELSERLRKKMEVTARHFHATGISLVLHPDSPWVPTVHMNRRYLRLVDATTGATRRDWFGGGADLTPYYLFDEDAAHFHRCLKTACDGYEPTAYPRFKRACDDYFFLKHRGESRGIGGIFFDYLDHDSAATFVFVQAVGEAFLAAYPPIVERRSDRGWTDEQKHWQQIRRGRYVEFNLIADRGTLFGLETGGRTESILMSLPPVVRWDYDPRPQPASEEQRLLDALQQPRNWLES